MELQEPFQETGFQRWRRAFPWLHLLRVPGIAGQLRLLLFAIVCSFLLAWLVNSTRAQFQVSGSPFPELTVSIRVSENPAPLFSLLHFWAKPNYEMALGPFAFRTVNSNRMIWWFTQGSILLLLAFSGLVISRMAAGLFAKGVNPGLKSAVLFGLKKFPALLASLIFPLLLFLVLFVISRSLLAISQWNLFQGWGATNFFMTLSLFPTFLLVLFWSAFVIGWPFLAVTLAVENSDGFDAWSRSFDYLRSRFFVILLSFAAVALLGIVIVGILDSLMYTTIELTRRWLASSGGSFSLGQYEAWVSRWQSLLQGYTLALYWSAATAIYMLTRHSVDRIPLDEFRQ